MVIKDILKEEKFQKNRLGKMKKVKRGRGHVSHPMLSQVFHYFLTLITHISQTFAPHQCYAGIDLPTNFSPFHHHSQEAISGQLTNISISVAYPQSSLRVMVLSVTAAQSLTKAHKLILLGFPKLHSQAASWIKR